MISFRFLSHHSYEVQNNVGIFFGIVFYLSVFTNYLYLCYIFSSSDHGTKINHWDLQENSRSLIDGI